MRIVRFVKAAPPYNAGELAGFDDTKAQTLVSSGKAVFEGGEIELRPRALAEGESLEEGELPPESQAQAGECIVATVETRSDSAELGVQLAPGIQADGTPTPPAAGFTIKHMGRGQYRVFDVNDQPATEAMDKHSPTAEAARRNAEQGE